MKRASALGCLACRLIGLDFSAPAETHHLTDCGFRRGHAFTIPLCGYHHVGRRPEGMSKEMALRFFGPNVLDDGKAFADRFGKDDVLLGLTNKLLGAP